MQDNQSLDVQGVVVYTGNKIERMDEYITAVPWHVVVLQELEQEVHYNEAKLLAN